MGTGLDASTDGSKKASDDAYALYETALEDTDAKGVLKDTGYEDW